jgi:homoserine acetyltransferase
MSSSDLPKVEDLKLEKDYETYKLGTFTLKSGGDIPDAFIAYKTLGDPSLPAIIYPTWYSGCKYHLFQYDIHRLINISEQQYPTTSGSQAQTRR